MPQQNILVPSVSRAAGNALAMRQAQENIRSSRNRNTLAEKQIGGYDQQHKFQQESQKIAREATAISTAIKFNDQNQADQVYKKLGGTGQGIKINGKNVAIDYKGHRVTGPSAHISEMMDAISRDPKFAYDARTGAWAASKGISITQSPGALAALKSKGRTGTDKKAALKRISDIRKQIATLEETDAVTKLLVKSNPELAKYIGKKIPPELKRELVDSWDAELKYLSVVAGIPFKPVGGSSLDGGDGIADYDFIVGTGLVKRGAKQ